MTLRALSPKIIAISLVISFSTISSAADSELAANSKIGLLQEVAKAIGLLGDAVIKITDGVKHLVKTSSEGVSFILVEKTKSRLLDLSARSTNFTANSNQRVIEIIDEYLEKPSWQRWEGVNLALYFTLRDGKELLDNWKKERSDFILEEAYQKIALTLSARIRLLERLRRLPRPTSQEELLALSKVNIEYKQLVGIFRLSVREFNKFLKHDFSG